MAYEYFEIDRTYKCPVTGENPKMQISVVTCDNCGGQQYHTSFGSMPDWFHCLTLMLRDPDSGAEVRKQFDFCSEKCLLDNKCLTKLLTDFASKVKITKKETKTSKVEIACD